MPDINIGKFNQIGTWHNRPQSETPNPYEDFQDAFSYLKGKHTFKFGYEYTHIEADSNIPNYGRGSVNFSRKAGNICHSTALRAKRLPTGPVTSKRLKTSSPVIQPVEPSWSATLPRSMTWSANALFAQDDWRLPRK